LSSAKKPGKARRLKLKEGKERTPKKRRAGDTSLKRTVV